VHPVKRDAQHNHDNRDEPSRWAFVPRRLPILIFTQLDRVVGYSLWGINVCSLFSGTFVLLIVCHLPNHAKNRGDSDFFYFGTISQQTA
jgi:hypothetical protein